MTSLLRKGSVSTHHCWPLEKIEEYERVKKLVGPGNISNLIVSLVCEWLRKQEGTPAPKIDEPPKIFTSFEQMDKYFDSLPIEELVKNMAWLHKAHEMNKEKWKERKNPLHKKPTFTEQIGPLVGIRQIDTRNLESK